MNNMLLSYKKESIKWWVPIIIEKITANIYSDDLIDNNMSSLLASLLANTVPKEENNKTVKVCNKYYGQYDYFYTY